MAFIEDELDEVQRPRFEFKFSPDSGISHENPLIDDNNNRVRTMFVFYILVVEAVQ